MKISKQDMLVKLTHFTSLVKYEQSNLDSAHAYIMVLACALYKTIKLRLSQKRQYFCNSCNQTFFMYEPAVI